MQAQTPRIGVVLRGELHSARQSNGSECATCDIIGEKCETQCDMNLCVHAVGLEEDDRWDGNCSSKISYLPPQGSCTSCAVGSAALRVTKAHKWSLHTLDHWLNCISCVFSFFLSLHELPARPCVVATAGQGPDPRDV